MLYIRLAAAGAPARTIALLLAELWGSMILAVVVLSVVSNLLGPASGTTKSPDAPLIELKDIATRWHHLSIHAQILAILGVLGAIILFIQALVTIRKTNRDHPL
jgi:hypothetical protein